MAVHHIVYLADGGSNTLDNLITLCSRHHTIVHAEGFGTRDEIKALVHKARRKPAPIEVEYWKGLVSNHEVEDPEIWEYLGDVIPGVPKYRFRYPEIPRHLQNT